MSSLNKFQLIGNLTRKPETTQAGKSTVTTVDIAVNESWRDDDGNKKEKTNFFRVKAWGKLGENVEKHLDKGSAIFVEGAINNNNYEDGQGNKVYSFEFIASDIKFLGAKKQEPVPAANDNPAKANGKAPTRARAKSASK